jgi:hypothetical protein
MTQEERQRQRHYQKDWHHNSADYPIWCCLCAAGFMAGPCANPNIGVVTLGLRQTVKREAEEDWGKITELTPSNSWRGGGGLGAILTVGHKAKKEGRRSGLRMCYRYPQSWCVPP